MKTHTNSIPHYLAPASSTALVDFLASSPPPSSPYANASSAATHRSHTTNRSLSPNYANDPFRHHPGSEISHPGHPTNRDASGSFDGRSEFSPISTDFPQRSKTTLGGGEKRGWKKVFGGGGSRKKGGKVMTEAMLNGGERVEKSKGKRKKDGSSSGCGEGGSAEAVRNGSGSGGGFMGVGRDGVWISRKNFLKT